MKKKDQTAGNEVAHSIRPEESAVLEWINSVKFKKVRFGGVDEKDVWKKIDELNRLYEKLIIAMRAGNAASDGSAEAVPEEGVPAEGEPEEGEHDSQPAEGGEKADE